jgi:DNA-binding MarR family transcriptional regulator
MPRSKKKRSTLAASKRGGPALDLNNHIAARISVFANRMSRAASRFYREGYGIGVVEWRVLMFVGFAKETSANSICRETDLDKGAVSRSLNVLADMGIVRVWEDGADNRRRNVALTAKGRALHDRIVPVSVERQRRLLSTLSTADVRKFMELLERLQIGFANRKPFRNGSKPANAGARRRAKARGGRAPASRR